MVGRGGGVVGRGGGGREESQQWYCPPSVICPRMISVAVCVCVLYPEQ